MKELFYKSTRNSDIRVTASQAILKGLSDEGGLFFPERIPALDRPIEDFANMMMLSRDGHWNRQQNCYLSKQSFFSI